MSDLIILDLRQLKEIKLNIYYTKFLAHGTDGHNLRILQARMAMALGFDISEQGDLTFRDTPITFGEGVIFTLDGIDNL